MKSIKNDILSLPILNQNGREELVSENPILMTTTPQSQDVQDIPRSQIFLNGFEMLMKDAIQITKEAPQNPTDLIESFDDNEQKRSKSQRHCFVSRAAYQAWSITCLDPTKYQQTKLIFSNDEKEDLAAGNEYEEEIVVSQAPSLPQSSIQTVPNGIMDHDIPPLNPHLHAAPIKGTRYHQEESLQVAFDPTSTISRPSLSSSPISSVSSPFKTASITNMGEKNREIPYRKDPGTNELPCRRVLDPQPVQKPTQGNETPHHTPVDTPTLTEKESLHQTYERISANTHVSPCLSPISSTPSSTSSTSTSTLMHQKQQQKQMKFGCNFDNRVVQSSVPTSLLSLTDHRRYLSSPEGKAQLSHLVDYERCLYNVWDYVFASANRNRFTQAHPVLISSTQSFLSAKKHRIFLHADQTFQTIREIIPTRNTEPGPVLTHTKTIYQLGVCPRIALPIYGQFIPIETEPAISKVNPLVTNDPCIADITSKHDVDFILSTSAMKALTTLYSLPISSDATVPIQVKEVQTQGGIKKHVYIEKPFLSLSDVRPRRLLAKVVKQHILHAARSSLPDDKNTKGNLGSTWYNLWKFGDYSLLIRSSVRCVIQESDIERCVDVVCPIEYQSHRGYENLDDVIRAGMWISLFVKPDPSLVQIHVDPITNTAVGTEVKRMSDVIPDGAWPIPYSNALLDCLRNLKDLGSGSYLLHKPSGSNKISILQSSSTPTRSETSFSLTQYYQNITVPSFGDLTLFEYVPLQWTGPPDQVPCTFPPAKVPRSVGVRKPLLFKVCLAYKETGSCDNVDCTYAHLDKNQISILCSQPLSPFLSPTSSAKKLKQMNNPGAVTKMKKTKPAKKGKKPPDFRDYDAVGQFSGQGRPGGRTQGRRGGSDWPAIQYE